MEAFVENFTSAYRKISEISENILSFVALLAALALVCSLVRFLFGKRAQLGKAFTSAMEILFLYLLSALAQGLDLEIFQTPLPFFSLEGGKVQVFCLAAADFGSFSAEFARLLLLALAVNLLNAVVPEGKRLWQWLLLRAGSMVLVVMANYGLELALNALLPQGIASIGPVILIGAMVLLLLMGSLKLVVGAALFLVNPVVGALYTFFFSRLAGRVLARAILSAGLITALVYLLNRWDILAFTVHSPALLPALLATVGLWYLVDKII